MPVIQEHQYLSDKKEEFSHFNPCERNEAYLDGLLLNPNASERDRRYFFQWDDINKSHFANLKEWIRECWEDDYEESPEDIRINYDTDTYYEVYNECQCEKIILEIVEKKVENSYNLNN